MVSDPWYGQTSYFLLGCEVISYCGPDLHFLNTDGKRVFTCRHSLCCEKLILDFYHFSVVSFVGFAEI